MRTFAVGDIHGCFRTLEKLLSRLDLDESRDQLWLTGDLVNRGPASLEVLRWARQMEERLGDRFVAVIGNHDLHAVAAGRGWSSLRGKDTLDELLAAPDGDDLLAWLARRPLLHRYRELVLVHAGVLPEWTAAEAQKWATAVENSLRQEDRARELMRRAGDGANAADPEWRALAALTRLRALTPDGAQCAFTGPPEESPVGCVPWFEHPRRRSREQTFVVGHWAAMGFRLQPGLVALDSGCAWGGPLTAICLESGDVTEQTNRDL